jgi:hypothetical protein
MKPARNNPTPPNDALHDIHFNRSPESWTMAERIAVAIIVAAAAAGIWHLATAPDRQKANRLLEEAKNLRNP